MKVAVRYLSRKGNTKKIADAIAGAAGVAAEVCEVPVEDGTDLLFVGGAIYAGKIDPALRDFVAALTSEKVKRVAVFSTAMGEVTAETEIRQILAGSGIDVTGGFHCRGKFLMFGRNRPNLEDIQNAVTFAGEQLAK